MVKLITESLAGRIGLITVLPLDYLEVSQNKKQPLYASTYPELVKRKQASHRLWYDSYLATYLEKDIRQIGDVGDLRDFRRFIQLLAANTAQLLNMSRFANDLGVAVNTIKRWISILEATS